MTILYTFPYRGRYFDFSYTLDDADMRDFKDSVLLPELKDVMLAALKGRLDSEVLEGDYTVGDAKRYIEEAESFSEIEDDYELITGLNLDWKLNEWLDLYEDDAKEMFEYNARDMFNSMMGEKEIDSWYNSERM